MDTQSEAKPQPIPVAQTAATIPATPALVAAPVTHPISNDFANAAVFALPTTEVVEAAKKEWSEATDRMAVVKKYPFLQAKPAPIAVAPAPDNGVKAPPSNNQPSSVNPS